VNPQRDQCQKVRWIVCGIVLHILHVLDTFHGFVQMFDATFVSESLFRWKLVQDQGVRFRRQLEFIEFWMPWVV
jgi:hypothetical protein